MAFIVPILMACLVPLSLMAATLPDNLGWTAAQSLASCQQVESVAMATKLEALNPQLGTLYKLAWMELGVGEAVQQEVGAQWVWRRNRETWSDEWKSRYGSWKCKAQPSGIALNVLPKTVLSQILDPWASQATQLRKPLGQVLLSYQTWNWLKTGQVSVASQSNWIFPEQCEWKLLSELNDPSSASSGCNPKDHGLIGGLWLVQRGDAFIKKGRWKEAFTHYHSAVSVLDKTYLVPAVWYRLAVTGLVSGQSDEWVIRGYRHAIRTDMASTLEPVYKATLENMVCDRVSQRPTKQVVRAVQTVYQRKDIQEEISDLAKACGSIRGRALFAHLASSISNPQQKANLLSLWIVDALERDDQSGANQALKKLAHLSKSNPLLAHRAFFKSLTPAPQTKSAIQWYSRNANQFTKTESARVERWLRKASKEPEAWKSMKLEANNTGNLQLPVLTRPPVIVWPTNLKVRLVAAFQADLSELSL